MHRPHLHVPLCDFFLLLLRVLLDSLTLYLRLSWNSWKSSFISLPCYFLSTGHKLESFGKREPKLGGGGESVSNGLWASLWGIFLINDWCRRAQPTMVGTTAGQVVLSGIIKQAEQARGSKPVNSVPPPWSLSRPCLQVPKWVQALTSLHDGLQAIKNEVNPFLLRLLLAICTKEREQVN